MNKLKKDFAELEMSFRDVASAQNEKFDRLIREQAQEVQRLKLEAQQRDLEFNSLFEIEQNTQKTLAWTADQLNNHKQSVKELVTEIQALKNSTSWRITEPLRALLRKISG